MNKEQSIQLAVSQLVLPDQISIRAWQEADYTAVCELAVAEGWTTLHDRPADGLLAWKHSWPVLVVMHDRNLIGFLRALTDEAVTLYVADLLVAPAWRGQGISSRLLKLCHLLYPSVRFDLLSTEHAEKFYQSQGFRSFQGFRKSYQ